MQLTKFDVAEAHISAAVRLYFQEQHIASVYMLAASAREILTTIGEKQGQRTILHGLAADAGLPLTDLIQAAHEKVRFLKHADKDPTAVIDLDEEQVSSVLLIACGDFGRLTEGKPIEAQVYEAWWFATTTEKISELPRDVRSTIRNVLRHFPSGLRSACLPEQKRMGWEMLKRYEHDPTLKMDIKRVVDLAAKPSA